MPERSLILLKPDAVLRGLVGDIIARFERKGIKITALKMIQISQELAEKHYAVHKDKPFFRELVQFITSGPVVAMVLEGNSVIREVRKIVGATSPLDAEPGTIRADFGLDVTRNLVHASDSEETAKEEIANFFTENELLPYQKGSEEERTDGG